MVGIYAPNQVTQRIALWHSLLQPLYVGRPGLLMGDFNMCVDASQSEHSIMDVKNRERFCAAKEMCCVCVCV